MKNKPKNTFQSDWETGNGSAQQAPGRRGAGSSNIRPKENPRQRRSILFYVQIAAITAALFLACCGIGIIIHYYISRPASTADEISATEAAETRQVSENEQSYQAAQALMDSFASVILLVSS